MTDREAFTAMLDKAGIVYRVGENEGDPNALVLEAHNGPRVEGYTSFVTLFHFDEHGNLVKVGIWE